MGAGCSGVLYTLCRDNRHLPGADLLKEVQVEIARDYERELMLFRLDTPDKI